MTFLKPYELEGKTPSVITSVFLRTNTEEK
jgi:hypothetical protein